MPTYEYQCTQCERVIELYQSITAAPKKRVAVDCAQCSNHAPVRRLIGSGGGLLFKGSGFYQTDYRSESYKTAAKAESGDGAKPGAGEKSDGKSEPKKPKDTPPPTQSDRSGGTAKPATTTGDR